jgi:hypothetical protein
MSVAAQEMRDELNWSENQKGLVLVGRKPFEVFLGFILFLVRVLLGLFHWTNSSILADPAVWCEMDLWLQVNTILNLCFVS